jgi:hypothetical protein
MVAVAIFPHGMVGEPGYAVKFPHGGGGTYIRTFADLRTMDQLEELRGCDKRLTAGMLDRLGDLRRGAYAPPAGFTTHAFEVNWCFQYGGAIYKRLKLISYGVSGQPS